MARAIRRQERELAAGAQQRHHQYQRRDALIPARHGGRQARPPAGCEFEGQAMRRARPLLGTYVEIEAAGLAAPALERAVDAAFGAIARVHRLMSFHDGDSDVSRLNRDAASAPGTIDGWTAKVLKKARMLFDATE